LLKQVVVSNETPHAQQAAFIRRVEPILIAAPPGPRLFSRSWGPFLPAKGVCSQLRKCARNREFLHAKVSLSVKGSAHPIRNKGAAARNAVLICLSAQGAMIDAPPADSFNPNKEIGRDSSWPDALRRKFENFFGGRLQGAKRSARVETSRPVQRPGGRPRASRRTRPPPAPARWRPLAWTTNTFIPGEITVVPGTTVTWVNRKPCPHGGGYEQRVSIEDPRQGRQFFLSLLQPQATMTTCVRSIRT